MNTLLIHAEEAKTFTVNDVNGKLKEGIKHCFLSTILLDVKNPPSVIRANNGSVYQVTYDNVTVPANTSGIIKVLASFQSWEDGNFVVVRNLSEKE